MRFRCVNGICVLQRLESKRQSAGGIILPDSAQKKSEMARVLESCPSWVEDGRRKLTELKSGDIVCISKYSGQEFEVQGDAGEFAIVLVRERDILCILDDFTEPVEPAAFADDVPAPMVWGDGIPA